MIIKDGYEGGSWCFRCFKCSSWLSGVLTRCHKCFQCHFSNSHFLRALHSKKPIVSIFFYSVHLCSIGFFFFFNHHSFLGESSINHSLVGTCPHHGDMLVGPIFVLTHFQALHCFTWVFSFCIFTSFIDNVHIIGLTSIVLFVFWTFCFLIGCCGVGGLMSQMFNLVTFYFAS